MFQRKRERDKKSLDQIENRNNISIWLVWTCAFKQTQASNSGKKKNCVKKKGDAKGAHNKI